MGCDLKRANEIHPPFVSIHAPAWGATNLIHYRDNLFMFQSTHPHGVRLFYRNVCSGRIQFQSTHPHGVRPTVTEAFDREISFNPRTRMGCDIQLVCSEMDVSVSIHAPAWGATFLGPPEKRPSLCFNPRTRMGCDILPEQPSLSNRRFNPRTRMGCDMYAGAARNREEFQSTHPHGVRHHGSYN